MTTTNENRRKMSEKAQRILEGAMQEFMAQGYTAASMDRIAVAAGVSKPTLYSYFQDKEGLFAALIEQLAQKQYRTIVGLDNAQIPQDEAEVVLRQIATNLLDTILNNEQLLALIRLAIAESGRFPTLAKTFIRAVDKPAIALLSQYLASRPELKLQHPEAVAQTFIGTLVYFVISQELLQGKDVLPISRDNLIDTLISLIAGIRK
ncbi:MULTISPECIES: TetR/AcrR family transcriptional regulator [Nostocales]|uniref:TetR/AcrR family transcriptional regulator n=3 Tax=Nostocales TaxID=1161 RepID=A0A0C1N311_9CYAN|nr:TetR/AcrR family transcriptional regulator [Tolypothrix bouteillei]KAF3889803.1 TetR/AcrR family transcriptional regulator [Tolypothrix bouteillei VB521301]